MICFASDIHLGGGDPAEARAVERRFVAWLDRVGSRAGTVVLAGDVFDFWFEYGRVVPQGFVRTLGKLAGLTDRGVRVIFLTGNHDMWVNGYLERECGVEVYTSPQVLLLGGQRVFVAHGDNMCIEGQPMLRLLNRVFRSRLLRRLFAWGVHPDLAMRFGRWWSGRSRKAHGEAEALDPSHTDPLVGYARGYAAAHGVDRFVFGHMHIARDYREGALQVVCLGSWERFSSWAELDDAGHLTLKRSES